MLSKKEYIRLFFGVCIVVLIFMIIALTTLEQKEESIQNFMSNCEIFDSSLPDKFSEEVLDSSLYNANKIQVSKDNKVIGFCIDKPVQDTFLQIKEDLLNNGWQVFESGFNTNGTFYKNSGKYTWMFVNCVEVCGSTSVVLTFD